MPARSSIPELVGLFCDLYATHAPEPDPAVLAMTAANGAHHAASAALVLPSRSRCDGSTAPQRPHRVDDRRRPMPAGPTGSLDVGPVGAPAGGFRDAPLPEPQLRPIRSVRAGADATAAAGLPPRADRRSHGHPA